MEAYIKVEDYSKSAAGNSMPDHACPHTAVYANIA